MKNKTIFVLVTLGIILVLVGAYFLIRNTYYDKYHFTYYGNGKILKSSGDPVTFGNGNSGIVLTSKKWKIIPGNRLYDYVLWGMTFKNTSRKIRKLTVHASFKDSSGMLLSSGTSSEGWAILPNEYQTYNGKTNIPKDLAKRIFYITPSINSQRKEINETGYSWWQPDEL